MGTLPIQTYGPNKQLVPYHKPELSVEVPVRLVAGTYLPGTVLGEIIVNEVQTVTITGATGGTFTLAYEGQTTGAIAYNALAAAVQTALEGLTTIGAGNVAVAGSAGGPYTVTFQGAKAQQDASTLVVDGAALTGGGTPSATVLVTTTGGTGLFAPYDDGASDGRQTAKALLRYGCVVTAEGFITGVFEHSVAKKDTPAFISGFFWCKDLVGLNAAAVSDLGRLVYGNVNNGLLRLM